MNCNFVYSVLFILCSAFVSVYLIIKKIALKIFNFISVCELYTDSSIKVNSEVAKVCLFSLLNYFKASVDYKLKEARPSLN